MPRYQVTSPDGKSWEVTAPDGATQDQVLEYAKSQWGKAQGPAKPADPTDGMSTGQKLLAGIGQGMTSGGRALLQGISKITGAESVGAGLVKQSDIDEAKQLDAPLLKTGAGRIGSGVGTAAIAAPAALIPGANTYVGASLVGAGTGAALTDGGLAERANGAGFGALGGLAGKGLGDALAWGIPKVVSSMASSRTAAQAANAQRDAAVEAAKQAGYVLPPADVRQSLLNEALGGLSGKIKTAQMASQRNQGVTNAMAKKALGVADDAPLNLDTLRAIRSEAGNAYEAVKSIGQVKSDAQYTKALDALKAQYEGAAKDFPGLAKGEVTSLVDSLKQPAFEASSAVDAIKVLRETADKAFRTGDAALGKAAKSAAGEMESLLERNIQASGAPADLLKSFQEARKTIAKTYSVEKALNDQTGDVSAQLLASQLKRGKPLSGELETIAKTGAAFPKATQALKETPKAWSPLDMVAGGAGAGMGSPTMMALATSRPVARSLLLSKAYQGLLANPKNYAPGLLESTLPLLQSDPLRRALPIAGGLLSADLSQ